MIKQPTAKYLRYSLSRSRNQGGRDKQEVLVGASGNLWEPAATRGSQQELMGRQQVLVGVSRNSWEVAGTRGR
jgi:hypothetical protein